MASKQELAKRFQGYEEKPMPKVCSNCQNFTFDKVQTIAPSAWNPNGYWEDKNLRCKLGGFAVKKRATCNAFSAKEAAV